MSEKEEVQKLIDGFYFKHGQCCAGCDWWRHFGSITGECIRHAPKEEDFPVMRRNQVCGDFQDLFDWETLPKQYLLDIGYTGNVAKVHKLLDQPEQREGE